VVILDDLVLLKSIRALALVVIIARKTSCRTERELDNSGDLNLQWQLWERFCSQFLPSVFGQFSTFGSHDLARRCIKMASPENPPLFRKQKNLSCHFLIPMIGHLPLPDLSE
jgi:hypothetical protein